MVEQGGNDVGRVSEAVTSLATTLRTQAESVRAVQDSVELADR